MRYRFLVLLLTLLFGGCLEFDGQDVAVRYDAKADRIDIQVVYRGLFVEGGTGSTDQPMEKALKDLEKVRQTGAVRFWGNWPFVVDLSGKIPAPLQTLAAHVDVENGALFTDPQGVLCGYQFVRIRDAKSFLQKVNTALELAVQARTAAPIDSYGPNHTLDDDTRDILREFFRAGQRLLLVEPGRIELRLPCSAADHRWVKEQLESHLLNNLPREMVRRSGVAARRAEGGSALDTNVTDASVRIEGASLKNGIHEAASFRFFWDNEWSIVREEELTRIALGVKGASVLHVKKASDGFYHDGLLEHLRGKGETIEAGVPDAELDRRFESFRGRDAVLPPQLAAARGVAAPAAPAAPDKEQDK